jgi:hypothetical protein
MPISSKYFSRHKILIPGLLLVTVMVGAHDAVSYAASTPRTVAVAPRSLNFVQDGLHNCGTVAMLISWAKTYPREAAALVRKQANGRYRVQFRGMGAVEVSPTDLSLARRKSVVRSAGSDRWAEIVLTAFTKLKSAGAKPNFALIEWIYAGEIAQCLTGRDSKVINIKPMSQGSAGQVRLGASVSLATLDKQLKALHGVPAVAYTNRCIHIWSILNYDAPRRLVQVRNPRRLRSVWMPLTEFRRKFQLMVHVMPRHTV